MNVPYSLAIVGLVLIWTWLLATRVPNSVAVAIGAAVVLLAIGHNVRRGEWGFRWRALAGSAWLALLVTAPAVVLLAGAGAAVRELHDRRDFLGSLAPLVIWGAAQQWVLQTVLLREAQGVTSRRGGIALAALLFAVVHLPNPLLTVVTFAGGWCWCAIYDRHPNIVPLAFSHALGTLALRYAFDPDTLGRLRVGYSYLLLDQP